MKNDEFDWNAFFRYTEDCMDALGKPEEEQPRYRTLSTFRKKKKIVRETDVSRSLGSKEK